MLIIATIMLWPLTGASILKLLNYFDADPNLPWRIPIVIAAVILGPFTIVVLIFLFIFHLLNWWANK